MVTYVGLDISKSRYFQDLLTMHVACFDVLEMDWIYVKIKL